MVPTPLVTVLLPVHNDRRFVGRAVGSILDQSFPDFELLILDDGSTDGSIDVVREFHDPRLRILRNGSNTGVARTLNAGLAAAKGELVARMDADDISEPMRFERQVGFLEANGNVALVGCWARWIDEADRPFTTVEFPTDPAEIERRLLEENCIFHSSVMFRRRAVQELGGYSLAAAAAQDYELWLRLSERHTLANVPEYLLRYRVHRGQVSFRKIGLQCRIANAARYKAALRRHQAGRLPDPAPFAPPKLLGRLRGERGSTGGALASWGRAYRLMGRRYDALAIALLACAHAPLSRTARSNLRAALGDALWPPALRSRVAWYTTRLRSIGAARGTRIAEPSGATGVTDPNGFRFETPPVPGVSVVICTLNRSGMLRDAILSLEQGIRGTPPDFLHELIVVDNGSTDDTEEVVSKEMRRLSIPLRYVAEPAPGLSVARNSGARAARYDVIAFVDDDVLVGAGWLNAIGRAFADFPEIACVGGNTIPRFDSGRPAWVDDSLLPFYGATRLGETRREVRYPEHPFGGNMAMRRFVLEAIGGFDPGLGRTKHNLRSNEESDLFRRADAAGFRTLYEPSAVLQHRVPAARAQQRWILSRSYWQGVSDVLLRELEGRPCSRRELAREGLGELLKLLRETHGGYLSPRRILWHLHGLSFEARVHRAYRAGKARRLIFAALGL